MHGKKRKISVVLTLARHRLIEEYALSHGISLPKLVEFWTYEMLASKVSQQLYDTSEVEDYIDLGGYKAADEIRARLSLRER